MSSLSQFNEFLQKLSCIPRWPESLDPQKITEGYYEDHPEEDQTEDPDQGYCYVSKGLWDRSIKEISEALGMSEAGVKSILVRTKPKIPARLFILNHLDKFDDSEIERMLVEKIDNGEIERYITTVF